MKHEGDEELDTVLLDRGENTTCTVNLHGAAIVSWRVENEERIFTSRLTVFDAKQPVRGGISLIFPQYGEWMFGPQNGFARLVRWSVEEPPRKLENGNVEAVFCIGDSDFTRSMWHYVFKIFYKVTLYEAELGLEVRVENVGKHFSLDFNFLVDAHFRVPDVTLCEISGFEGRPFVDRTQGDDGDVFEEFDHPFTLSGWTNKIYLQTEAEHRISGFPKNATLVVTKSELMPEIVLWNPWVHSRLEEEGDDGGEDLEKMRNFADDEYLKMISMKLGCATTRVRLKPGDNYAVEVKLKYDVPVDPKYQLQWPCPLDYP